MAAAHPVAAAAGLTALPPHRYPRRSPAARQSRRSDRRSDGRDAMKPASTSTRWLIAIVVLGALLRVIPIWFGLPYAHARPDETTTMGVAVGIQRGDLNPHFFNWPTLTMYVDAGLFG